MGLRETKAQRTRDVLHRVTLELAERDGFDAVTIEQIAEAAEVGISTLYRYFPNKDAILLHPVAESVGVLADLFTARPIDEPTGRALGEALHEVIGTSWQEDESMLRLRAQLDVAPGPRARLWDLWNQNRVLLEEAIAARIGADAQDLRVGLAAGVTMTVLQMALDLHRDRLEEPSVADLADRILGVLNGSDAILPTRSEP
jgi:AcrR family transcriptional regulator